MRLTLTDRLALAALLVASVPAQANIHAGISAQGRLVIADTLSAGLTPFHAHAPTQRRQAPADVSKARHAVQPLLEQAAVDAGLDVALLHAVVSQESAFNPCALSRAGAAGLMQLMPATARRFGVQDRFDPAQNLRGGAAYLAWLLDHFNQDLDLALAGYNAGEGAVHRYGNQIPPFAETRAYVASVRARYGR